MRKRIKQKLPIPDVLGQTIQSRRKHLGLKAETVAESLGISTHHYSDIENNRSKPGYLLMISIFRHLGVDPNLIVYPERTHMDEKRLQMVHAMETCSDELIDFFSAVWSSLPNNRKPPR